MKRTALLLIVLGLAAIATAEDMVGARVRRTAAWGEGTPAVLASCGRAASIRLSRDGTTAILFNRTGVRCFDLATRRLSDESSATIGDDRKTLKEELATIERARRLLTHGSARGATASTDFSQVVAWNAHDVTVLDATTRRLLPFDEDNRVLSACELDPGHVVVSTVRSTVVCDVATGRARSPGALSKLRTSSVAAITSGSFVALTDHGALAFVEIAAGRVERWSNARLEAPLVVSPGRDLALAADGVGAIHVVSVATMKEVAFLGNPWGSLADIACTASGVVLATTRSGQLLEWDLARGRADLGRHHSEVSAIAVSLDGRTALTGSEDRTVRVWDATTGELRSCFREHDAMIRAVALSKDGAKAASSDWNGRVFVWETRGGRVLSTLEVPHFGRVAFSEEGELRVSRASVREQRALPRGRSLVCGAGSLSIERDDGTREKLLDAGTHRAPSVTPDGSRALTLTDEHVLALWDLEKGERLRVFENSLTSDTFLREPVAISPDGALGVTDGNRIWWLDGGWVVDAMKTDGRPTVVAFLGSRTILAGDEYGRLIRYDR